MQFSFIFECHNSVKSGIRTDKGQYKIIKFQPLYHCVMSCLMPELHLQIVDVAVLLK